LEPGLLTKTGICYAMPPIRVQRPMEGISRLRDRPDADGNPTNLIPD
jgi:hypothetical protein